ncbi:hypothetical protein OTU49_007644 [Cherax quadricarinatus]|uniref:Protein kinase domain-containing protein n=1 Tax=Cherax quadricarinatus TaxID=27406 RepID=A0AAW0WVK2_CHEQU
MWREKEKLLGCGSYGQVALVNWNGKPAALKKAKSKTYKNCFRKEAVILKALQGAGGAPILYGMKTVPPVLLVSYKGSRRLCDIMADDSFDLLRVGLEIGYKLREIHTAGYVHSDLKDDNVMVEGSPEAPEVSIIDYGLTCLSGKTIYLIGNPETHPWYAPEVLDQQPSTYASDVFSYGYLMKGILETRPQRYKILDKLFKQAMNANPRRRPTLNFMIKVIEDYTTSPQSDMNDADPDKKLKTPKCIHRSTPDFVKKRKRSPTTEVAKKCRGSYTSIPNRIKTRKVNQAPERYNMRQRKFSKFGTRDLQMHQIDHNLRPRYPLRKYVQE